MLLSLITRLVIPIVAVHAIVSVADGKSVCDLHLSQVKMIPFEGNAGVDTMKMLPRRYQNLSKDIGVYARDEYLHDRSVNRRILQRKLWRWYRTTYLPSLRKRAT